MDEDTGVGSQDRGSSSSKTPGLRDKERHHSWLSRLLPWVTALCVAAQVLSLKLGFLDGAFYDAMHADVQGIDYFSLPRAYINLLSGRSAYDTFAVPAYGPHATWYLAHPALAVWLGSWLSLLSPWTSYGVYVALSMGMMGGAAWILAKQSQDPFIRRLLWLLLLGAFPTYWMYFVGNVQAVLVVALSLLFAGMVSLVYGGGGTRLIFFGLLLSLLSKPVVLLALPLLLFLPETRRAARSALLLYVGISLVFEVVPFLNPQPMGWKRLAWLASHPQFVRNTMNIYGNGLQVTPLMRDNSIHWLNLIAQSHMRLMHVDVFSLPVFLDTVFGQRTPDLLYVAPTVLVLALSVAVARLKHSAIRLEAALLLLLATSLVFFLAYPTVWEYQYTAVLPVAAVLLLLRRKPVSYARWLTPMLALAACSWLPSLYFMTEGRPLTPAVLTLIRVDRIVPVVLLFLLMCCVLSVLVYARAATTGRGREHTGADSPTPD